MTEFEDLIGKMIHDVCVTTFPDGRIESVKLLTSLGSFTITTEEKRREEPALKITKND